MTLFDPPEDTIDEPADAGAQPPIRRARLVVAYDGAHFHGFAENRDVVTVAGALRGALETIVRRPVELTGAGRTDAGVHAWGQVVSVDLPADTDLDRLGRRLQALCGPHVVLRSAAWTDPDFDARFSATWRHYRYHVLAAAVPNPFLAATTWHVPHPLDLRAMQLACDPLIGEHDFSSFCRAPKVAPGAPPRSLVRRVVLARWRTVDDDHVTGDDALYRFEIRANAFCHQMVRSIVGTLVDVGLGRLHAGEIRGIMLRRDRAAAGRVAPPEGLCLWEVGYPSE